MVLPWEQLGQEFVYPKKRAIELAKVTHEAVLAMPTELAEQITAPAKSALDEAPVVALKKRRSRPLNRPEKRLQWQR